MDNAPHIYGKTKDNVKEIKRIFGNSFDLVIREFEVDLKNAAAVSFDGMCDENKISETIIKPLTNPGNFTLFGDTGAEIEASVFKGMSIKKERSFDKITEAITGGNLVLFIENVGAAFVFSVQGFPKKSIEESQAEQNERGSAESFTDNFKDNITLLRRRLKTPNLIIENDKMGDSSNTDVLLCYLSDRVSPEILNKIKRRLKKAKLDTVLSSDYLRPFLDKEGPSLFSSTGFTQRPDLLAGKLTEGRIGIIVDGSPFALIVPYLFIDYFHALDDYFTSTYYALFIRILRIVCFFVSATLPGIFVAVCDFHPEVLPSNIMLDIAAAEAKTPFSLAFEAITIHLIYEIVREAGLRMPRAIGHAVSIVGALVVGDAAVTAGLIAAPMLMVVAFTAISSAVVSKLHESIALIRFALIIIGGLTGFFGVFIIVGLLIADICSTNPYGVPFSAPFSPYVRQAQRDSIFREDWRKLGKYRTKIGEMEF